MNPLLEMAGITLLPGLELRASIPYGVIKLGMHWLPVFAVCVLTNMLLGPAVFLALRYFTDAVTKIKIMDRLYRRYVTRTQKRIEKYIEKYGELGGAIFIGIPLPGSGSYSGALAANLIGLKFRKFVVANIIGVLIAGVVVMLITVTGTQLFHFFIKAV